jgi:cobalt-zinc-cadmium efflux system outer membrane protein
MSRGGVCLFLVLYAFAPPAAADSITVSQAIDEALQHNLSLFAERANLTIADAQLVAARLRPNPVFSFSADHLDWLGTGFNAENNGGPPEIAWRIDVPLERAGKREARIALASAIKSAAEAQFADAVRNLRQDVTLACIDVMAARSTRDLVAGNLRTFEDLVRVNRARLTAGSIAPSEARRSEVAMLQFRATVVRADLDLAAATARLRTLLGRPAGDPIAVDGDLRGASPSPSPDAAALRRLALASRPDLRALQLGQTRSTADLRLQEALGHIDYTVGAEYRRQQGIAGRGNSVGLFVSAPLPISSRNQGEIARASGELTQAERQIAAREAQIASEVESAAHEFDTMRDLVTAMEKELLAPATSARDTAEYTYRAGGATLLELLDAQRAFNDTMQSYVDAQAGLRRAAARLNGTVAAEVVP